MATAILDNFAKKSPKKKTENVAGAIGNPTERKKLSIGNNAPIKFDSINMKRIKMINK